MPFDLTNNSRTLPERLKDFTLSNHQQLEKLLILKMRKVTSPPHYVEILSLFYSYFGALEGKISEFISKHHLADFEVRRKAANLKQDIDFFKEALPVLAAGEDLPKITNHFEALGALYVMEGSTLGGSIIEKVMKKQLNRTSLAGFSFFHGYGEKTELMWEIFKKALSDQAVTEEESQVILKSADQTFLCFKNWIEKKSGVNAGASES